MKTFLLALAGLLVCGACAAASLDDYREQTLPAVPKAEAGKGKLTVTFVGVATLLFDDGDTAVMSDGFFTRIPQRELRSIQPDRDAIKKSLQRLGVKSLAAVFPVHSHFDHALDTPFVAMETGALLVGSTSTANIGKGYGFPEARIKVVNSGDTLSFGRFKVTFIKSAHLPTGFATGAITSPLSLPASAVSFGEGDCYSVFIEHEGKRIMVQGSAGFVPGALKGRQADVVYLGVGGLGTKSGDYQQNYWQEIVRAVGAKRVIPIHWDNFFIPLGDGPVPNSDFYGSMSWLQQRGKADGVDIRLTPAWQPADPFTGL